jgi:hypothetical protein
MPPEVNASSNYDPCLADSINCALISLNFSVWSFGLILYELCEGQVSPPREREPKISGKLGTFSESLMGIYGECVKTIPSERPSARDLSNRLQKLQWTMS